MAKQEPVDQQEAPDLPPQSPQAVRYTKEQIVSSNKYADSRDVLQAFLETDRMYSEREVESIKEEFLNKEAK